MKIFSGSANKPLAQKLATSFNLQLSETEIHVFPDGEKRVRILDTVVDEACIVLQPTSPPVEANYMELFFIVDAIKRSGASQIIVVMPYVGYQRQDHVFRSGEAVSLDVVIKTLEANGASAFLAFDFHSIKTIELFKIPVVHVSALPLFADVIQKEGWANEESVLVSPDMGGIRRIKLISEILLGMPYVAIEKNRDLATGSVAAEIIHGAIEEKKRAFIVDDMISSGKTINVAARLLEQKGIEEIFVFATHPVFSDDAPEILEKSNAKKIFVTDTIAIPKEKQFPKLTVISIADEVAKQVRSTLS